MLKGKITPITLVGIVLVVFVIIGIFTSSAVKNYFKKASDKQSSYNYSVGKSLTEQGKYSDAIKYLEKAVNSDKDNPNYLRELAVAKYNNKEYQSAIDLYNQLIKINSKDAFAYNGIANCYRDWAAASADHQKEYQEKAIASYKQAIDANQSYVISYNNLALLYQDMGKKDEAKKILEDGVKANPENTELQNSLKAIQV